MVQNIPTQLCQQWQSLSAAELEQTITQRLKNPFLPISQVDHEWCSWIIDFSFSAMRPSADRSTRPLDFCRWAAFCLRYLHPVVNQTNILLTGEQVLELINSEKSLLPVMIFGTKDNILNVLRDVKCVSINLTEEQNELLKRVYQRAEIYDGKTGRNWADAFAQSLAHQVYHQLHSIEQQAIQTALSSVITHKNIRELPAVSSYLERFAYFVEVTENGMHHGLALGYYNEFKARLQLIEQYIPNLPGILLFLSVIYALLLVAQLGTILTTILTLIILTLVFSLFYGRLITTIVDTFTWARAAQETLEQLVMQKIE